MPPHRPAHPPSPTSSFIWRGIKLLVLASSFALAGCAANRQSAQTADALALHLHAERASYLSQTKSDPLGSYLALSGYPMDQAYPARKGLANTALDFLGIKYRYGGDTPSTGFDCSGLVTYAAEKSLGLKLPHHSASLAHRGKPVKRKDLKKGDLVFFNTRGRRYSHVGIYLGDGKFVHAPRTGASVRIESLDTTYWKKRYNGARRLAANGAIRTSGK